MILYHSQAQISTVQGDVQEQEQLAGADKPHLLLLPAPAPVPCTCCFYVLLVLCLRVPLW
jgi:hypothetical protein